MFAVSLEASQVTLESGPAERLLGEKAAERREHQSRSVQSVFSARCEREQGVTLLLPFYIDRVKQR